MPLLPPAVVLIVAMVLLGWLFRQLKLLPDNAADTLNQLVLKLCFPALILSVVPGLKLDRSIALIALCAWIVMGLSALVALALSRALKFSKEVEGCLLLCAVLGNTAFLGYPMVKAYIGTEYISTAVIYDQLGSFLCFSSLGLWIAATYGKGEKTGWVGSIKRVLTFPAFIALITGMSLSAADVQTPTWMMELLQAVGALLVPIAMFAVGLNFSLRAAPGLTTPILVGLSIKMLLAPMLALGLSVFLLPRELWPVMLMQAAMPPMATAAALAASSGLSPALGAALVGFGVLIAQFWMPILLRWLIA